MTPDQKAALEGLVGRSLTSDEVTAMDPFVDARNDVAIASALSLNRTRLSSSMIGYGTVMECFAMVGLSGGQFLDLLVEYGKNDRDACWAVQLLDRGALDIGRTATQVQITGLKNVPAFADYSSGIDAVLKLGHVSDQINHMQVSAALNKAQGLMTL